MRVWRVQTGVFKAKVTGNTMEEYPRTTYQDCEFTTEQLRAQRLFVRVDINDALFDSCVLIWYKRVETREGQSRKEC